MKKLQRTDEYEYIMPLYTAKYIRKLHRQNGDHVSNAFQILNHLHVGGNVYFCIFLYVSLRHRFHFLFLYL